MNQLKFCFLMSAALFAILGAGCGGRPSQKEMLRRAQARKRAMAAAGEPKPLDKDEKQAKPKPKKKRADYKKSPQKNSNRGATERTVNGRTKLSSTKGKRIPGVVQQPEPVKVVRRSKSREKPLTLEEQRRRSVSNMGKIAQAMIRYSNRNRVLPDAAVRAKSGLPLLSWRVTLLPYLGYQKLYDKFKLDEPWDSPHNMSLLGDIPEVYQSTSRWDEKTNYLVPTAPGWMFGRKRGVPVRKVEDGMANTVMLVEVDDQAAVPWTQPAEFNRNRKNPRKDLGKLRSRGFFVCWGNGLVRFIPNDTAARIFAGALSIDGGESIVATSISLSPQAAATMSDAKAQAFQNNKNKSTLSGSSTNRVTNVIRRGPGSKFPMPSEDALKAARSSFSDTYGVDIKSARTSRARKDLAKKLLNAAAQMRDDESGMYVTLEYARKVGIQGADFATANDAARQLVRKFQLPPEVEYEIRFEVITKVGRLKNAGSHGTIYKDSLELLVIAIGNDEYEDAKELIQVISAMATRLKSREKLKKATRLRKDVSAARTAFNKLKKVFDRMGKPGSDAHEDNLIAGKYYGLLKGRWQAAIPLLIASQDNKYSVLAKWEKEAQASGKERMKLANRWWDLARLDTEYNKEMKLRATFWYLTLIPNLPANLDKVKAKHRVAASEREFGKEEIKKLKDKARTVAQRFKPKRRRR